MRRRWIEAALCVGLALSTNLGAALGISVGTGFAIGIAAGISTAVATALGTAGPALAQRAPAQSSPSQPWIINDEEVQPPPPEQQQQQPPPKPTRTRGQKPASAFEHDPDLDAADQLSPSQVMQQPIPDAVAMPSSGGGARSRSAARSTDVIAEPGAVVRSAHPAKARIIACSGVFGRDSSHAKLAAAFAARNVGYAQVDASTGGKVWASVLYNKDPKQRLEVWWSQPAARSTTHLIVINGQSEWIAPGDLHLGLTLAELEKLNGKPFKLIGFDKDGVAAITDWDGGTLAAIVGGCKVGVSLRADPHTARSALTELPADRSFGSADAALRTVNPTVSEILVAY